MNHHRDRDKMAQINRTTIALLAWTSLIVMAGIMPLHNFTGHAQWSVIDWTITMRHWRSPWFYVDVFANIILFYPFGLLLARQFSPTGMTRAVALVGTGLLLSVGIEFFQVFSHHRHPALSDVVSNTIGTALGVLSANLLFSSRLLSAWLPPAQSYSADS